MWGERPRAHATRVPRNRSPQAPEWPPSLLDRGRKRRLLPRKRRLLASPPPTCPRRARPAKLPRSLHRSAAPARVANLLGPRRPSKRRVSASRARRLELLPLCTNAAVAHAMLFVRLPLQSKKIRREQHGNASANQRQGETA